MAYRYRRFRKELMEEDSGFGGGPGPGDPFPDFDLPTTTLGERARSADYRGRPFFVTLASYT